MKNGPVATCACERSSSRCESSDSSLSLPTSLPTQVIGRQVLRSGDIRRSALPRGLSCPLTAEFVSKIEGGLQELEETIYWLELLTESDLVPSPRLEDLQK